MTENKPHIEQGNPGKSTVQETIEKWGENIQLIDSGGGNNGYSKKMVLEQLANLSTEDLTSEQSGAIEEIKNMSLATGIDPERIKELAKLF